MNLFKCRHLILITYSIIILSGNKVTITYIIYKINYKIILIFNYLQNK